MATATLTSVAAGAWKLDPVHSTVGFEISYLAGTFKGSFRDVQAELAISDDSARLEGRARVESVDVKDETLATHLQSPDFFDSERYPELRFTATDLSLTGEPAVVRGDITIKGVTKPIELTGSASGPLYDPFGNERVGLVLEATIDRTDFGVDWNMPLPTGGPALANEVTIVAELQFVKAA
jgi:polyisoprenoid-binding protein YceI